MICLITYCFTIFDGCGLCKLIMPVTSFTNYILEPAVLPLDFFSEYPKSFKTFTNLIQVKSVGLLLNFSNNFSILLLFNTKIINYYVTKK